MKKITLSVITYIMLFITSYAQELLKSDIDNLLKIQGEVTFNFTVQNEVQLNSFSKFLTIINFDSVSKNVKAWANQKQFNNFLASNIPYQVFKEDNDINERLMSSDISDYSKRLKNGYTLEFPINAYPTYSDYATQMQNFETEHSDIVDFFSLGTTEEGDKDILFVKISDNVLNDEAEPKLLYTSSMHGDEIAGFPIMLNLIDYLITAYKDDLHPDHNRIANLINTSEIWINPNANPDGTYHMSHDNTSVAYARRGNANNVDLNRNYPDYIIGAHPDGEDYQAETLLFMQLAKENQFVIAANFHGGSELVNYPWDNTFDRHPDDSWWTLTAGEYRDNTQNEAEIGYMDDENDGITNGADWYLINGSRQDYMNYNHQCKELTIELSQIKKPYANQLIGLWNYNQKALIDYLMHGTYGFRGIIKDAYSHKPIKGATIKALRHDSKGSWAVSDTKGIFYRPIHAGIYDFIIEAPNYQPMILINQYINNYETKALDDILMSPILPLENTIITYSDELASSSTTNFEKVDLNSNYLYQELYSNPWIDVLINIDLFR